MTARAVVPTMTNLVAPPKAETPEADLSAARRRAERIRLLATAVAENLAKVRELVREAKAADDHLALGYSSWTAYLADLFGDEPLRLARDVRQELVAELAAQGMSTRAIAPIVGVAHKTVARDLEPGVSDDTPDAGAETPPLAEPIPARKVTGLDGKSYTPPPKAPKPIPTGEGADLLNAETESKALGRALITLSGMKYDAHRDRVINQWWPLGKDAVPPDWAELFEPDAIREIAGWLMLLADDLEGAE